MFGKSFNESKVRTSSSSSREPVRNRVFGTRGRGFLPLEGSTLYESCTGCSQRSNSSGKWGDSEKSVDSGWVDDYSNRETTGKSKNLDKSPNYNKRNNTGKSDKWNSNGSFGKNTTKKYYGSKDLDEDDDEVEAARYEDSPEDIPNSCARENKFVKKKQGRNDDGWNKENLKNDDWKDKQEQQRKQPYIPNPDPETVEDLFSQGIASGINFDCYDNIEVTVTGERIPPKIGRFEQAEICGIIMENIRRSSYVKPTPVQKHALPIIMSGRDMMACAQTGSGKTAAFLIPTINCILESEDSPAVVGMSATPQLLVLTPTRELAIQIYVEAKKLTYNSHLVTELCYGGTDVRHQLRKVQNGCNILIATCGRLLDFLNRGRVSFSKLRHLIIDEADKMLDMKFLDDIETIIKHETMDVDDPPQILLFSATFPQEVQNLARMYLRNYIFLAVGMVGAACTDVEQKFFLVQKYDKKERLIKLLEEMTRSKTLVFVEKKRTADVLAVYLSEKGFPTVSMHGDREQKLREEALRHFRSGSMDILVATAVASRGLDIRGISYVINYDLPKTVDEYVHRIGRTGRVGNRGLAISFYDPEENYSLARGISKLLVQAQQEVPSFLEDAFEADDFTPASSSHKKNYGNSRERQVDVGDDLQPSEEW